MDYKLIYADILFKVLNGQLEKSKIILMIEKPKFENMGDLSFPCFGLAKSIAI